MMFFNRLTRYLIVILLQVVCIQAYILSDNETSWDDVVCTNGTIATIDVRDMKLDVTLGDNTYWINNENSRLPTDMTSAWVGYYQFPVGFEYIGCVETGDLSLQTNVTMQPINGDPGHCFLGCSDLSIVGVNNEECYCVDENLLEDESINTDNNYCNVECEFLPGVACGRTTSSSRGRLSLYRRNNNVTSIKNYDGNCLSFEPNEDDYQWQACRTSLDVFCVYEGEIKQRFNGKLKWFAAGEECIKPEWKPLPYFGDKLKLQHVKTSDRFWTGIFKTYSLFKVSNNPPPEWVNFTSPDMKFGVLEYNTTGGYHYLHFVEKGENLRKALCNSESEATTTTTTISPTMSSSTTSTLSGSNIERPTTNNNTLMIGVIAGVCSFVAIVIIVVSIILVKRKPCRSVTKEQKADVITGSGNDNEAYSVVGGHERAPSASNKSDVDYNYLDVELSSNPQIGNKSGDLPNIYSHAKSRDLNKADDTYDTTITSRKEGQPSGENMYNKLGDDENTYNTTNNTQQNQQDGHRRTDDIYNKLGDENEDTYDSTVTKRQNTDDAIYDKTMTSSGDDMYSQINKTNKPKITQTDNVYGSHK